MSDFDLKAIFMSLIMFSAFIIGVSVFTGDISERYNVTIENRSALGVSTEMREYSEDISRSLNETQTQGWLGASMYYLSAVVNSILMMLRLPDLFTNLILGPNGIGTMLFLPEWFVGLIITAIIITVTILVLKVLAGRGRV